MIGAGSSGIASCQVLHARGIPFDCIEKGSQVGGNWRYMNDNGMSSAYDSLSINTSRQIMEYAAYPMPKDYPDFPTHRQIAAYFDDYVDHFGFRDQIRFRTEVTRVERAQGGWAVTLDDGTTTTYGSVFVANGHHWDPRWPEPPFPGEFDGVETHAHHYKTPEGYEGKNVLVLGIGNSACDIAVETSRVSNQTFLAMRRGAWVIPKYFGSTPSDELAPEWMSALVPFSVLRGSFMRRLLKTNGHPTDFGLPEPDHKLGEAHPTISSDLYGRIGHGRVKVKPNIERLEGDSVRFDDGSVERIDRIVYCTGYKISFPFFDHDLLDPSEDNRIDLYRRVVHPDLHGPLLHRPRAAALRDHADRRAPVGVDRRRARGQGRAARPGHDGAGDREGPEGHGQALRHVQAPHDPGGRASVHAPARARAQEVPRQGSGRNRAPP